MSQLSLKTIKLGDSADTSKNFLIKTPAVADGTLVIERGNGTDVLSIAADGKVTLTPTTEMTPLGVGQTWQNVKASRALTTDYTNNTGRPIVVQVMTSQGTGSIARFNLGESTAVPFTEFGSTAVNGQCSFPSIVIPVGWKYSLTVVAGSVSIASWWELR